jgi:prepilin-type processing-associated H-X9-DG protein
MTHILPYVEQENVYNNVNLFRREYAYCGTPTSPGATVILTYICPSDYVPKQVIQYSTYYFGVNSYMGNAGSVAYPWQSASLNGVLYYNSSIRIQQIKDGTSNTLLVGERYNQDPDMTDTNLSDWRGWAWTNSNSGADVLADTRWQINTKWAAIRDDGQRKCTYGSGHTGGANFLLCDGSVHFFSTSTDLVTLIRLSIRNDGNTVTLPD